MATVHHVQGKRSVNKTEKSLKRGILDLIISREAEHCETYARREVGGGQHELAGMSALTTLSVESRRRVRHTITLLFPPLQPIWLRQHHTNTISRSWRWILVGRQWQMNALPNRKDAAPLGSGFSWTQSNFHLFAERFGSFRISLGVSLAAEPLRPCELLKYVLKST